MKYTSIVKRETKVMIGVIAILLIVVLGTSYALFMRVNSNSNNQVVTTGTLQVEYASENGYISSNEYTEIVPMSNNVALTKEGFQFSVKNTGNIPVTYQAFLYINYEAYEEDLAANKISGSLFDNLSLLKLNIKINDDNNTDILKLADIKTKKKENINNREVVKYQIYKGTINANDINAHVLRLWMDEEADISEIGKYVYLKLDVSGYVEGQEPTYWVLTNDENNNKRADVGDLITYDTESFYVISNDDTNIKALSQYNLNVGSNPYGTEDNIQNSNVVGYKEGKTTYGNIAFSSISPSYSGSIAEEYVNTYKAKLEELGATINNASLIAKDDLETLGCSANEYSCISAPSFVYSSSYWNESAYDDNHTWAVRSDANFSGNDFKYVNNYGVRPVITISANEL